MITLYTFGPYSGTPDGSRSAAESLPNLVAGRDSLQSRSFGGGPAAERLR